MPHLGSLILTHEWDGEIKGLKDFKPEDRPNPIIPFFAFRVMVGIGVHHGRGRRHRRRCFG